MTKVTLAAVGSLIDATTAAATINSNTAAIVTAFDNTLSRDGTSPNQMEANLDMNSNHILNLPAPISTLEPLRLVDANTLNGGGTIEVSALPVGGLEGQVLTKNSNSNYDVIWKYDAGSSSSTVNVLTYGADPTGATQSTAAFQAAITAAGTNGTVFIPPGDYNITGGLNLTNIQGGGLGGFTLQGSGNGTTILRATGATNAILDLTGSAGMAINDLMLYANPGSGTNYCVLLAASTINPSDVIRFTNIGIESWASTVTWYNCGCSDGDMINVGMVNYNPSAAAVMYYAQGNPFGATSNFTTVQSGNLQIGDWDHVSVEVHDLGQIGSPNTYSTVLPLVIGGSNSPLKWFGGIVAGSVPAANGGTVTFEGPGTVGGVSFIGTQFYGDNGKQSDFMLFNNCPVTGLTLQGCATFANNGIFAAINSNPWTSLSVTGNAPYGAPAIVMFLGGNNGTVTSSLVDCQGLPISVGSGGTISHTVMLNPGTITGNQTSNGTF